MRLIVGENANVVRKRIFAELEKINTEKKAAIVLVPEQFTMQTDLQLLQYLDTPVIMDIKVKSFGSLSREVLDRVGGSKLTYISESGRRMLAQFLLSKHKDELSILSKGYEWRGVAMKMLETLSEFRNLDIKATALDALCEQADVPPLLQEKLQDMSVMLTHYEALLGDQRLDNEARLFLLSEKIVEADWLEGVPIYIDGFQFLSVPELQVLLALEQRGARLILSLVLPPKALTNAVGWWSSHSASASSLRFYGSLQRAGFTSLELDVVGEDDSMLPEAAVLNKYLFSTELEVQPELGKQLEIWKAVQPKDEVLYLAGMMRRMVVEEGYRWRDFQIITNQAEVYFPLMDLIFKQYDIPAFIDERKPLQYHYLVRYLLNALDMVNYHFSYPMVFACLKTGLAGLEDDEVVALDYFARAKHLRGTMYFDARYFEAPDEKIKSKKLEGLRDRQPLAQAAQKKFQKRFQGLYEDLQDAKTVRQYSTILYHFMTAPEVLDALHADDANKTPVQLETDAHIIETVTALLDQIVGTLGDMEISIDHYSRILSEGLSEASLGIIPPAQDEVQVVELSRGRSGRCKVQIVVGMTDVWLPAAANSHTVFIREEKKWLEKAGIPLRCDETRILEDEAFSLYECLARPTERLILSYPLSDSGGTVMNESVLITRAKAILPNVVESSLLVEMEKVRPYLEWESLQMTAEWLRRYTRVPNLMDENVDHARAVASMYAYFKEAHPKLAPFLQNGLYYTNQRKALEPDVVKKLYPAIQNNRVSISELENWQGCPYKHFMRYGIRPEEPLDYVLRSDELGTVLHGALDQFTHDLESHPEWIDYDDAAICEQMDAYFTREEQEALDAQRSKEARNVAVLRKMRYQAHKAGRFIVRQLRESKFQPRFNEVAFGEHRQAPLPPIYLDIDGEIIRIEGRIDRVDTWQYEDTLYARVIDYKSGFNSFDISRVWAGLDLQLMLYLRAVLGWEKHPLPAGVFYLSLKNLFAKTDELDQETIDALLAKELRMDGVFIDDPEVIDALDQSAREGAYHVISKQGRGKVADNGLSAEALEHLLARSVQLAQECVRDVMNGDIRVLPIEPTQKGGCEYCEYDGMCRFERNRSGNRERVIEKLSWKDAKERLEDAEEEKA